MKKFSQSVIFSSLMLALVLTVPAGRTEAQTCGSGLGEPPFLSLGIEPNLLLLLDNSGSMLDPAFQDETEECYDDTFDTAETYSGYFDRTAWYFYDFNTEAFASQSGIPAFCESADYWGRDTAGAKFVCLDLNTATDPDTVTGFAATGNFLNWAAASKFDVQKKILTGGKYDDVNQNLQMESRGCLGRRFIKEVTLAQVDNKGNAYQLVLGVRGPEEVYETWLANTAYSEGDIVIYRNILYQANTDISKSAAKFDSEANKWDVYKDTRWYPNHSYPANTAVYDKESGSWHWTQEGGTSLSTAANIFEDTAVDWVPYDGTSIEIYNTVAGGFNAGACQEVLDLIGGLTGDPDQDGSSDNVNTSLGQIKKKTEECMGFDPGGGDKLEKARKASFNHAMQECWYYNKFERWQPGSGTVNSMKNACANVYDYMDPLDITPWDSTYVCAGSYQPVNDKSPYGYVGRCWEVPGVIDPDTCVQAECPADKEPGDKWSEGIETYYCATGRILYQCIHSSCSQLPASKPEWWKVAQVCEASGGGDLEEEGWTNDPFYYFNPCTYKTCMENNALIDSCPRAGADDYTCSSDGTSWTCYENPTDGDLAADYCYTPDPDGYLCVEQAIKDFCGILTVPEVIDPSDSTSATGEVWNAPAYLIDSGIIGQMDLPLATMKGYIRETSPPSGLLHTTTATELRMGAMAFNYVGAKTECDVENPNDAIEKYCPEDNKDGAHLLARIQRGTTKTGDNRIHRDDLVDVINDIRATSWTPLAEAMFNALGYYTQDVDKRLDQDDFLVESEVPVWNGEQEYNQGDIVKNDDLYWQRTDVPISTDSDEPMPESPYWTRTEVDPVTAWCQENHILIITEGASTADINEEVREFAILYGDDDSDNDDTDIGLCTDGLDGSTYLDDLTWFAWNAPADELYPDGNDQVLSDDGELIDKQNIITHLVVAGSGHGDRNNECDQDELMWEAAANGGSSEPYFASDAQALEESLTSIFLDLRKRASAGSAASVISSARGGEGAIYQAIFWPEFQRGETTITWVGDVHGLFLDEQGQMYEDTNGDRTLTPQRDIDGDGDLDTHDADGNILDKRVIIFYDNIQNRARACYNTSIFDDGACDDVAELTKINSTDVEIKYLWSANKWLSDILDQDIAVNRTNYISNEKKRHIFTWNDLNNDGIVDDNEIIDLETTVDWENLTVSENRGPVINDFGLNNGAEVDMVVSWLRGNDWPIDESETEADDNGNGIIGDLPQRSRQIPGDSGTETWRLGDIIHSTPMTVANPAEAYHLIYNDFSYAQFLGKYRGRRHMVYFGANDGLLHAVNAGFYSERDKKFCLVPLQTNGACLESTLPVNGVPELGAEMWAYLPYNLQPHVKCLTDPNYTHKYFVDQRPRIFDVQIFEEETACRDLENNQTFPNDGCIHPNGWGTILVGGMRFGGTPVNADELGDDDGVRQFISSYFILDITNPEEPPVLLGELTRKTDSDTVDLGYSTVIPTMIIMKGDQDVLDDLQMTEAVNKWYLLFGSGPYDDYANIADNKAIKGISSQAAKVSVLPLDWLTRDKTALRIPAAKPDQFASPEAGTFVLYDGGVSPELRSDNGFVSDMITVDFDINPSSREYKSDVAYFGTVQGDFEDTGAGGTKWNEGGLMYRLVTKKIDLNGSLVNVGVGESVTSPWEWKVKPLIDLTTDKQPITAAASVGTDGYNFWIYFGTGRFFDADDKTDDNQQAYYGIKEPIKKVDGKRYFTWEEVVLPASPASDAGDGTRGLWRVDQIEVGLLENSFVGSGVLTCRGGGTSCLPDYLVNNPCPVPNPDDTENEPAPCLKALEQYISGNDYNENVNCDDGINCVDGWYKEFYPYGNRERNVGQATLLGGLVTFTTYQPFSDVCKAEGNAYLYGVYYRTGTAWHENIFGTSGDHPPNVMDKMYLGRGLATTPNLHVGSGGAEGPKAFVQTSTGEIIEIQQENLPIKNYKTGPSRWKEYNR